MQILVPIHMDPLVPIPKQASCPVVRIIERMAIGVEDPLHEEPPPAKVYVNKAGIAELSALPGIGAKKAEKIIDARKRAPIESFDQLAKAAGGVSAANLERMKPFVSFER